MFSTSCSISHTQQAQTEKTLSTKHNSNWKIEILWWYSCIVFMHVIHTSIDAYRHVVWRQPSCTRPAYFVWSGWNNQLVTLHSTFQGLFSPNCFIALELIMCQISLAWSRVSISSFIIIIDRWEVLCREIRRRNRYSGFCSCKGLNRLTSSAALIPRKRSCSDGHYRLIPSAHLMLQTIQIQILN